MKSRTAFFGMFKYLGLRGQRSHFQFKALYYNFIFFKAEIFKVFNIFMNFKNLKRFLWPGSTRFLKFQSSKNRSPFKQKIHVFTISNFWKFKKL